MKHTRRMVPGFRFTIGWSLFYLSLIVLIPLATIPLKASELGWSGFWAAAVSPRAVAAYRLSIGASFIAAVVNVFFGLLVAWVLVRYPLPGKRLIDGLVDLPFALPTAVAGISLTTLYSKNGWIGRLLEPFGIHVAYTWVGIVVVLTFIG